jgi:hypothetical protein
LNLATLTPVSTDAALHHFDSLPAVDAAFMLGSWRGTGYPTGHPLDGALEAYHWWGKRFESAEAVHPLVFETRSGGTACLNPALMRPALAWLRFGPLPKAPWIGRVLQGFIPLLATRQSKARLRMTEHRGVVSATMVYDHLPINDVFRRLDDNTVLGLMDRKGDPQPFFFVLRRTV